jgi:hypothetical protein
MRLRRSRTGWIASLIVVALAAAIVVSETGGATAANGARSASPLGLLLRLHDLPPGYLNYAGPREGEDAEEPLCGRLTNPEDTPPGLASVVERFHPKGCLAVYARIYTVPDATPSAAMVATGALPLPNATAADAVWEVVPTMLGRLSGDVRPHRVPTETKIGDETELLHTPVPPFPLNYFGKKASYLVWRDGNVLATALAVSDSYATSDQVVAELAPRQQMHVHAPTPYTAAERYDGEVGLDDPAIPFPVYWLGREFRPGGKLPPNLLGQSYYRGKPRPEQTRGSEEGPGAPLGISYYNIQLDTWTPATWPVFTGSRTGRAITSWKCTQTRTVTLPAGSATIYGGYKGDPQKCPRRAPEAFTAWVDFGSVKVVVNPPFAADFIEVVNPYGTFAGMEAIVRALRVRPPAAGDAG